MAVVATRGEIAVLDEDFRRLLAAVCTLSTTQMIMLDAVVRGRLGAPGAPKVDVTPAAVTPADVGSSVTGTIPSPTSRRALPPRPVAAEARPVRSRAVASMQHSKFRWRRPT